jgi:hypothetical protein
VVLDYAVHHRRANGSLSPKVFKWRRLDLAAGVPVALERRHPVRPVTVRRYHPGPHRVVVLANGAPLAEAAFELVAG